MKTIDFNKYITKITIGFRSKFALLFLFTLLTLNLKAQDNSITVSGTVISQDDKQPLPGSTVTIKNTTIGTSTDISGKFRLNTDKPLPLTLVVTVLGFQKQEIVVRSAKQNPLFISLVADNKSLNEVTVTSRRRKEVGQDIPIPISVVQGTIVEETGGFNVNRLKELIPTVQLYSSNPRNTTLNIRGLGSTFGLTNDGIDPGVGFYVDGVYFARPAATALDFIDVDQIEVLRGPQGTLFGKNTTAGAFNITTRQASFTPEATAEVSYGNYGFIQAKASISGPFTSKLAGRLSFSGTQRDGLLYNVRTQQRINDLNNIGLRGQLLYTPNENIKITLAGDATDQNPNGYAQVVAGVVTTQRAPYRQFNQIISDLNYQLPTQNPFDRIVDHDSPWRSGNELGGISLNADFKIGQGTLTSTTAWRYWNWDPLNDRDFTGLPVLSRSQATSKHEQWTQEVRYAGDITKNLSGVIGVFAIGQDLVTDPQHIEESGAAQWRFSQSTTSSLWSTPGLFDGFGIRTTSRLKSFSGAVFTQLDWSITDKLHVLPGLRFNYDEKDVDFKRETYGGLQTTDPNLLALKRLVYTDQAFQANVDENNFSGQLTLSYRASEKFNSFVTYSTSFKPIGVNLGGLPTANGAVLIDLAQIKPETVNHLEVGVKTRPTNNSILNVVYHHTDIKDYQTQVQTAEVGVNRGYLANAERVRVQGIEVDGNIIVNNDLTAYGSLAYTDGKYIAFTNAPVPLEETGGPAAFKDISGGELPGISKWAGSFGAEYGKEGRFFTEDKGRFYIAADAFYRSSFSSSPSPSQFLNIDGYTLVNARVGFRSSKGISFTVWSRNLLNKNYFEQLLPAAGNAGHYAAVLGDPQTFGVTLRYAFKK